jgi:dihydrodipicolinate synthase/N-acetylneuraminate lyase
MEVDIDAYAGLIEFQIANGTHGIVVNGTTSEPSTLTVDERNQLVKTAIDVAHKRIPVVAATGSQSHAETVALTEFATKAGADALLIVTPYYSRPPQRGLVQYYTDLGKRTDLYNRGRSHVSLGPGVPDPPAKKECVDQPNPHHLFSEHLMVCARSVLGSLHHEYSRKAG